MPKLTKKGQVTIPKDIRNKLGLKRGDMVEFSIKDEECIIKKKKASGIDKWLGALGKGFTDEFIEEIRGDRFDNCC